MNVLIYFGNNKNISKLDYAYFSGYLVNTNNYISVDDLNL